MLRTNDVFGVSRKILNYSYIDRGNLDSRIRTLLDRDTHIALRGESKCGKSWLRQKNQPNAAVVQCRLNKTVSDLYVDALSQLGLTLKQQETRQRSFSGTLEASTEAGLKVLAKLQGRLGLRGDYTTSETEIRIGENVDNLRFVADALLESGRRLVIEDFHYLPTEERRLFATDLKAFWDYGVFVTIIGIWAQNNLMLHLNPDLAGRVEELSIFWSNQELREVIDKGSEALKIELDRKTVSCMIDDSFGTVGILQKLALATLDELGVTSGEEGFRSFEAKRAYEAYEASALGYAEQLNALYQTFAQRIAKGIRQRTNATGIYAHMLKSVMESDDDALQRGLHVDEIFRTASTREPRIQKPNLRQILRQIDRLQVDPEGRGLVLTYDETKDEVSVVDKQLFLYRKYSTVKWPWEGMIADVHPDDTAFRGDE